MLHSIVDNGIIRGAEKSALGVLFLLD